MIANLKVILGLTASNAEYVCKLRLSGQGNQRYFWIVRSIGRKLVLTAINITMLGRK